MKKTVLAALALTLAAVTLPAAMSAQTPAPAPAPTQAPAAKPDPDAKANGKWHFIFDTQGGAREFDAEFAVDADGNVTGTWEKSPAAGTYKDGHLVMDFETHSEEAQETATLHIDGKFDDTGNLTGNWTFSSYDGSFTAAHPKP